MIHSIHQDAQKFASPTAEFVRAIHRSAAIGLISPQDLQNITLEKIKFLLGRLAEKGIASSANLQWAEIFLTGKVPADYWYSVASALNDSPMPQEEWKSAREWFQDDDLLSRLTGAARSSLARYIKGERATPDDVGERLHAVMMIAVDLQGILNPQGVRRWFSKRRSLLGSKAPIDLLDEGWTVDSAGYQRVRQLADSDLNFQAS